MMLSQLTRFAKRLWVRLSSAAHQVFRHLTQPASSNLVTGTLADLPRRRSELLVENALLRQQLIVLHRQVKTRASPGAIDCRCYSLRASSRTGNKFCRSFSPRPFYAGIAPAFACFGGSNHTVGNPRAVWTRTPSP